MRVCLIASGSKGNAIYLESRDSRILIDAGLSARELTRRLALVGVDSASLNAIFVSHEHGDHVRGVGPLSRRYGVPVHVNPETHEAISALGAIPILEEFDAGTAFCCRDLRVETFPLTHDAVQPVGFVVETRDGKVGIATDLGIGTRLVRERLRGCRVLILEANHDEALLRDGPYPWHLKQRIRGNHGHLSNSACGELLKDLLWEGLEMVFLAHLSETNNRAELAVHEIRQVLDGQNLCGPQLIVGRQDAASVCLDFS
ncbi:Phosphoribosyl 1,2-cyclic phosphodiesterase [Geoalkalibacter ferrihydriticus]|uniref:Beta-lactamase n=2 Tax=Geoalkalibacter ferrihydriticus TaxID=392333 RepID=A0A0C2HKK2_9BACT|nr:MBL fold metallo-hydrolase [Geoalkalibacter ferrihydriticus]KIH75545.1 beta-lactamase [Geoalkalibacter ferrihydriticus DSM 17813]SDM89935.1 Phosphoribosyl 1,2-cyclic phosphodiesterase [Geoalkalibacter ferrihydriticus]